MTKNTYIFYNSSNKNYAKENRKSMTKHEGLVRHMILKQKKTGYKRIRQKMIGSYICDFYCSELLLCIEIDGGYHSENIEYDKIREEYMRKKGIKTVRYSNKLVEKGLHTVKREIEREVGKRKKELAINGNKPLP